MHPNVSFNIFLLLISIHQIHSHEDGYLRYVKDGCFLRGEALSCVKYKAVKIAKTTFFGDNLFSNETIKGNNVISLVPLDAETIEMIGVKEKELEANEPRSFLSEWTEVAKYFTKIIQEFFKVKGLKVNLPEGARSIEEDVDDDARGKKKKLAVVIPLLTLLATIKTKLLLIPVLLSVMLIKKLLLIAALLVPSLLSTLKACKHQQAMPHYSSYFGSSDATDYNSDYGSNYAYSSSGAYGKDWAANRAYNMKHRPAASPTYITAPGAVA